MEASKYENELRDLFKRSLRGRPERGDSKRLFQLWDLFEENGETKKWREWHRQEKEMAGAELNPLARFNQASSD